MKCPSCDGRKIRKDSIYSAASLEPVSICESTCTRCDENGNIPDPEPTLQECLETLKVMEGSMSLNNAECNLRDKIVERLLKLFGEGK